MGRRRRDGLNEQAMRFCCSYAKTNDRYQSAIDAGFSDATARIKSYSWLKDDRYIREINRLKGIVGEEVDRQIREAEKSKGIQREPPPPEELSDEDRDAEMRAHAARIADAATAANISKQWVLARLVDNYNSATTGEKKNIPAANQALNLIGTELGMFIRRQHIEYEDVTKMSREEAKEELQKALNELGETIPETVKAALFGMQAPASGSNTLQ
jgi:phage terminase small subunit